MLAETVGLRRTLHLLPAAEVTKWMAGNRLLFQEMVGPEPISRPDLERGLEARAGGGWAVLEFGDAPLRFHL